jgi:RHS repeat-associated protein
MGTRTRGRDFVTLGRAWVLAVAASGALGCGDGVHVNRGRGEAGAGGAADWATAGVAGMDESARAGAAGSGRQLMAGQGNGEPAGAAGLPSATGVAAGAAGRSEPPEQGGEAGRATQVPGTSGSSPGGSGSGGSTVASAGEPSTGGSGGHTGEGGSGQAGSSNQAGSGGEQVPEFTDLPACAAPIDRSVPSSMYAIARCLFEGDGAPQRGLSDGVLEARRIAVVRGRVLDESGAPLAGVTVSIASHPELGDTLTRADGNFDLAVNAGGELTVHYARDGYLPAQRRLLTEWGKFARFPDVALLELPSEATEVDLDATETTLAPGRIESDGDGTRQEVVAFAPGTQATLVLPNGDTQPLSSMTVRVREFTVGERGPLAMPAELPPNVGYTYAVAYTVDEAVEAGAVRVDLEPPAVSYVDNFLGFPTGTVIPNGVYAPESDAWIAEPSGVVLEILDIEDDVATVDTNGDGLADDSDDLEALGITDEELGVLGARYSAGQTLWRTLTSHFCDWDKNMGISPPLDAISPADALAALDALGDLLGDQSQACGSVIGCENQTLGENLRLSGTPYSLHYQSERTRGRKDARQAKIRLSGASIPESLKRIDLELEVAGRLIRRSYAPAPNLTDTYEWDGKDVYGRVLQGRQPLVARIGYAYDVNYQHTNKFGYNGNGTKITSNDARSELVFWSKLEGGIGNLTMEGMGLGGWGLDVLHTYSASDRTLFLGDGRTRSGERLANVITTVAGPGHAGLEDRGNGGPATEALIEAGLGGGLACAPDGSLYVLESYHAHIRKVAPNGIISNYAGTENGQPGTVDGVPATEASIPQNSSGLALAQDGTLYYGEIARVRAISPDGIVRTVAGNGTEGTSGDGGLATEATIQVQSLALGPDGSLYIGGGALVRRVTTDGIITTVAGNGEYAHQRPEDGAPATEVGIGAVLSVAVSLGGELFIAGYYTDAIFKVDLDGMISTVYDVSPSTGLAFAPDGTLYASSYARHLWRMLPDGRIQDVVLPHEPGADGSIGDNGPATEGVVGLMPKAQCVGPDGSLYVFDEDVNRVRRVTQALPGFPEQSQWVASEDGGELYVFDREGRHLRTVDTLTRADLATFEYDELGLLASVSDQFGNTTMFVRSADGALESVVGPYGETTELTLDGRGYLASATNANDEVTSYSHDANGLLLSVTGPRLASDVHTFQYDTLGRLTRDTEPSGFFQRLVRTDGEGSDYSVALSTRMGRTRLHEVSQPDDSTVVRTITSSAGVVQTVSTSPGAVTHTTPSRTTTTVLGGDPRFGLQAPLGASSTIALAGAGSPTFTAAESRTVTLSDYSDVLSVTSLEEVRTLNGQDWVDTWDGAARTLTTTSPEGRQTVSTFDSLGELLSVQSASLDPVEFNYDAHGRMTGISAGDRTTVIEYGTDGRVSALVNALGERTSVVRDPVGRPVLTTLPDSEQIAASFDAADNLLSLTPPDQPAHAFTVAPGNLLDAYSPPGLGGTTDYSTYYEYNNDDQLASTSLPDGATIVPTYDATSGRLTALDVDGVSSTFSYDSTTGLLASIVGGGETIAYSYTGDIPTGSTWSGVLSGTVAVTLDDDFRVATETAGSVEIALSYDNDGLLTAAGEETIAREADTGLISGTALGVVTDAIGRNTLGETESYTASANATSLYEVALTHDDLGRIATRTETIGGLTHTDEYGYDSRGRLVSVTRDSTAVGAYGYDANDNRTSVDDVNGTRSPSYDAQDRLLTDGTTTYTYTASGSLATKTTGSDTTTYEYDALGALKSVTLPDGTDIEYVLDGTHRRIGKRVDGTLTRTYLYGDALRVLAELDGSGAVVSRFVYATRVNVPEYMIRAGTTYRLITDERGSVRLVVNVATGEVAQRIDYDAWGVVTDDTNPGLQPFGFAGGLYDENTGLVRFGARDYEPQTGRWTGKDPVGFSGGLNVYVYASSDPLNRWDPNGWFGVAIGGSGGAGYCLFLCAPAVSGGGGFYMGTEGVGTYVAGGASIGVGAFAGFGPQISVYSSLDAFKGLGVGAAAEFSMMVPGFIGSGSVVGNSSGIVTSVGGGVGGGIWGGGIVTYTETTSLSQTLSDLRDLWDMFTRNRGCP